MGNEQSQESNVQTRQEEHTDLSDISDDRDSDGAQETRDRSVEAAETTSARKPRKKKKKKRKSKKDRASSGSPPTSRHSDASPEELDALRRKADEDIQALREREPETFSIYARSDTSHVEDDHEVRASTPEDISTGDHAPGEVSVAEADSNLAGNGPATLVPTPSYAVNDLGRYICPFAEAYDCTQTFASKPSAKRHGEAHISPYICVVCDRRLSRQDTFEKHMAKHTALQIASAEAGPKETSPEQDPELDELVRETTPVANGLQHTRLLLHSTSPESETSRGPSDDEPHVQGDRDGAAGGVPREARAQSGELGVDDSPQAEYPPLQDADVRAESPQENGIHGDDGGVIDDQTTRSERQSTSPPSVFDETEEPVQPDMPAPRGAVKRKRAADGTPEVPKAVLERPRKRPKRSSNSLPTSVQSSDGIARSHSLESASDTTARRSGQITEKIQPRLQQRRQGTIDSWAHISTPGSNLGRRESNSSSHPPSTVQRGAVVASQNGQAGPSNANISKGRAKGKGKKDASVNANLEMAGGEQRRTDQSTSFPVKRTRKATYATPKGKRRAEPGIDYFSPLANTQQNAEAPETSDSEPSNMATSIGRRTFSSTGSQTHAGDREEGSQSEQDRSSANESDAERSSVQNYTQGTAGGNSAECTTCHRMFKRESMLKKHLATAKIHSNLYGCQECSEQFWSSNLLARHQTATGHGKENGPRGRTGAFSETEVRKLNSWRDVFCEDYEITHQEFNDMMTDTLKRGSSSTWNWRFITKADLLEQYRKVLPARNKRSMLRYRERNFQNLEGSRNWTADDDRDLIRLHKELGPRWSEIAKRLTRTVDAVSQRWRHKLQPGTVGRGEWSAEENAKFADILADMRRESGVLTDVEDWHIPWTKVSERMGTRSAQQCSNRYRVMHGTKQNGRWVKIEALEKTPGASRIMTPSAMDRRLRGEHSGSRSRQQLSEQVVRDEDGDDEDGDDESDDHEKASDRGEDEDAVEKERAEDQAGSESVENETKSAAAHRKRETRKTPGRPSRHPLMQKTPGQTLQPSQLFAQTQVNTSALKASPKTRHGIQSQDRPSPDIPIQPRRLSDSRSPLRGIRVNVNGGREDSQESEDDDGGEQSEATASDDGMKSIAEHSASSEESSSADSTDDEADEEEDVVQESAGEENGDSTDEEDEKDDPGRQSSDDGDTGSGQGQGRHGDFMASIHASARRVRSSRQQLPRARRRVQRLARSGQYPRRSSPTDDDEDGSARESSADESDD